MNAKEPSRAYSRNRFETPALTVDAALEGSTHSYDFDDLPVRVRIPTATEAGDGDAARMMVTSRWAATQEPIHYDVHNVDVEVDQPNTAGILALLAREKPTGSFEEANAMGAFAARAFDHWCRVARWRLRYWRVARSSRERLITWNSSIIERDTGRRLGSGPITFTVPGVLSVSVDDWQDIQAALTAGATSPLFYDLYFDGQQQLAEGDLRRATVDLANAVEVLLKTLLDRRLPPDLLPKVRRYAMRAPANVFLSQFGPELLGPGGEGIFHDQGKALEALFHARNDVLHSHVPNTLTEERCRGFVKAVLALLTAGEDSLAASGQLFPRRQAMPDSMSSPPA